MIDSCTPIPRPHSDTPTRLAQNPPKNTSGAKSAATMVKGTRMPTPTRSDMRPSTSEPVPLTAIAAA
jgi:hypothetical protein